MKDYKVNSGKFQNLDAQTKKAILSLVEENFPRYQEEMIPDRYHKLCVIYFSNPSGNVISSLFYRFFYDPNVEEVNGVVTFLSTKSKFRRKKLAFRLISCLIFSTLEQKPECRKIQFASNAKNLIFYQKVADILGITIRLEAIIENQEERVYCFDLNGITCDEIHRRGYGYVINPSLKVRLRNFFRKFFW